MKKQLLFFSFSMLSLISQAQWKDGGTKITTTQNVGIGTENPGYKLDVAGDIRSQNIIVPNGYRITRSPNDNFNYDSKVMGHYALQWAQDSWNTGGSSFWLSAYGGIKIFTAGLYRLGITGNGNVGIGIDNPNYRLDVNGTIAAGKLYLRASGVNSGWRQTIVEYDGHDFIIGSKVGINAHNQLLLRPGGGGTEQLYSAIEMYSTTKNNEYQRKVSISTERATFFNGGNVGIGTDNPQNKLDVVGTIRATEVKVETGWADFVFDKDYKLRSLEDVKSHIEEYKHLPDIPSEAEVKENGVSLGEMQAKLLQKIEELTLYMIELKEENQQIKKENQEIKQKLQNL